MDGLQQSSFLKKRDVVDQFTSDENTTNIENAVSFILSKLSIEVFDIRNSSLEELRRSVTNLQYRYDERWKAASRNLKAETLIGWSLSSR